MSLSSSIWCSAIITEGHYDRRSQAGGSAGSPASSHRLRTCADSKFSVGVSDERGWLFVSLCGPVINSRLVQGAPPPSPSPCRDSWDGLRHPCDPVRGEAEVIVIIFIPPKKVQFDRELTTKSPALDHFSQHGNAHGSTSLDIISHRAKKGIITVDFL